MGHLTFDHIKCVCFWVLCPCVVKIFFWSQKILENCEKQEQKNYSTLYKKLKLKLKH